MTRKSLGMEGLRHVADAIKSCNYINLIRVVGADAAFPSLALELDVPLTPYTAADHPYGTSLSVGAGSVFQVWPIDGDPSVNRSFEIANIVTDKGDYDTLLDYAVNDVVTVDGVRLICIAPHVAVDPDPTPSIPTAHFKGYKGQYDNRATINFYDKDDEGVEYLLESYPVGFADTDTDDLGRSAFIETVLEQQSTRFRCDFDSDLTYAAIHASLVSGSVKEAFVGGTNGVVAPTVEEWKAAWDLLRNESYAANLMFAAGNYEADVLVNCIDIAAIRRDSFFFDINPALPPAQALTWLKGAGLEGRQANVYHCPFEANDPTYGGKAVWGVSGEAVAACAKGDANFSGATPGIHYAPAGGIRAKLSRTGLKALYPGEILNRDDFYDARVNPVIVGNSGGAVIDDCLALWYKQDYRRFVWVNRIDNYIAKRFLEMAAALKFEPDGLTFDGLTRGTKDILEELVTSGALVPPRDPADGKSPYTVEVEQVEIDLWLVTWGFCPTGAARRIAGQPKLIK
jgi:hypothetical protein